MLNSIVGLLGDGGGAANSYESIATVSSAGSSNFLEFTSIPTTYKHLQIRWISRNTVVGDQLGMQFNSDSGSNYARHEVSGFGSSANAYASTGQIQIIGIGFESFSSSGANIFGAGIIDILDYANTSKNTTVRSLTGYDTNGGGGVGLVSGLWLNTAAINRITMNQQSGGNFASGTTFALYGIKG